MTADNLYNNILKKEIYPLVGNKTTYMHDLDRVGRKLLGVKFKGVFASDKIPILNDLKCCCILNLDKSNQPGSHWIALAKTNSGSMVYDSFGRCHTEIIKNLKYSGNGRITNTELDAEQEIHETDCGARCLAWLVLLDRYGPEIAIQI